MSKTVVTFGEIMLRLAPPGFERILQTPQFVPHSGGEAMSRCRWPVMASRPLHHGAANNPITEAFAGECAASTWTVFIVRAKPLRDLLRGSRRQPASSKVVYDRNIARSRWPSPATSTGRKASKEPAGFT